MLSGLVGLSLNRGQERPSAGGWSFDPFHNHETDQRLRGHTNAGRLTKNDGLEGFELAEVVGLDLAWLECKFSQIFDNNANPLKATRPPIVPALFEQPQRQ
uniref:Uncharacterized protein n=1 Tax=Pseudomonas fluorescens (strain SBW25) TaxID=216595 RepID=A4V7D5_PSEFS|nr:hypothetical protein pQBR0165 [Pseudomonas fluorescens SBW25]